MLAVAHLRRTTLWLVVLAALLAGYTPGRGQGLPPELCYTRPAVTGAVAWSPNGAEVAVAEGFGAISIYAAATGARVQTLLAHHILIGNLCFSPDGRLLASIGYDQTVKLWRVSDWSLVRTLTGGIHDTAVLQFSPDNSLLAAGTAEGDLNLWQVSDGTLLQTLSLSSSMGMPFIQSVSFSPDSHKLATLTSSVLSVWRISDGEMLSGAAHDISGDTNQVFFLPDGAHLLVCSRQGAQVWNVDSVLERTITEQATEPTIISPDGALLVIRNIDALDFFRVSDGMLLHTLPHIGVDWRSGLAFSPDGAYLAVATPSGGVTLWNTTDSSLQRTLGNNIGGAAALAYAPDGQTLATCGDWTALWHAADGQPQRTLARGYGGTGVHFSPDGQQLMRIAGNALDEWRISDGTLLRTLPLPSALLGCAAISPDGSLYACYDGDQQVTIWRTSDGSEVSVCATTAVRALAFSPDNMYIYFARQDDQLQCRGVSDGHLRYQQLAGANLINVMACSPDGQLVATARDDHNVTLYRADDGALLGTLAGHDGSVTALAFSADGQSLASGGQDYQLKLWDVTARVCKRTITWTGQRVAMLAFTPNGQYLASVSADGLAVWRAGVSQPDLLIQGPHDTTLLGDNIYNVTDGQTSEGEAGSGQPLSYRIRLENDGSMTEPYIVTLSAVAGETARLFDPAGTEITDLATGSGWTTPVLAPGQGIELRAEVTLNTSVPLGAARALVVTATATAFSSASDAVQADTAKVPLSAVALSAVPSALHLPNTPITLTAAPTGGNRVEYQFKAGRQDAAGWHWTAIRNYQAGASCAWTPGSAGLYTLVAYAREVGSVKAYDVLGTTICRILAPLSALKLATMPPAPQPFGTPITLTATPTGGAQVEYQFRAGYQSAGSWHWSVVRDYAPIATCAWTPAEARRYTLAVWAREHGSAIPYAIADSLTFHVTTSAIAAVTLTAAPVAPRKALTAITLTAHATGGDVVEYRFRAGYQDVAGWHWADLTSYQTTNSCGWTPTVPRLYTLVIYAREAGSASAYQHYGTLVYRVTR